MTSEKRPLAGNGRTAMMPGMKTSAGNSSAAAVRRLLQRVISGEQGEPGREFTIDELAREAGVTVRNIRAYQDRDLLPPPQIRGRTGIYSDVHLTRLKVISQLLERHYSLANIRDLLSAWEEGRDLTDVLGLDEAIRDPWAQEMPAYMSYQEIMEMFGSQVTPEVLKKAGEMGYIVPEGDRIRIPNPRIISAGKELAEAGIPLSSLLDEASAVREQTDQISQGFVRLVLDHLITPQYGEHGVPPANEVPQLAEFIKRVRPIAEMIVSAELGRTLEHNIKEVFRERVANVMDHIDQEQTDPQET